MGGGATWGLRVVDPTPSLTSSWCRHNPVPRDPSSLARSLLGFPVAVPMQLRSMLSSVGGLSLLRAFPPFLLPDKFGGYWSSLPGPQSLSSNKERLSLLGAGIGSPEPGRIHQYKYIISDKCFSCRISREKGETKFQSADLLQRQNSSRQIYFRDKFLQIFSIPHAPLPSATCVCLFIYLPVTYFMKLFTVYLLKNFQSENEPNEVMMMSSRTLRDIVLGRSNLITLIVFGRVEYPYSFALVCSVLWSRYILTRLHLVKKAAPARAKKVGSGSTTLGQFIVDLDP